MREQGCAVAGNASVSSPPPASLAPCPLPSSSATWLILPHSPLCLHHYIKFRLQVPKSQILEMESTLQESQSQACPCISKSLLSSRQWTSGLTVLCLCQAAPTAQRLRGHEGSMTGGGGAQQPKLPTQLFHYKEDPETLTSVSRNLYYWGFFTLQRFLFLFFRQPGFHRWLRIFFPSAGFISIISDTVSGPPLRALAIICHPASGPAGPTLSSEEEANLGPQTC